MSTWRLEVGRAEVAVDEARDVLVEAEAEQEVVAGDRVGRRDGPRAADRRDALRRARSSLHPVGAWRARRLVIEMLVGLAARLGEALGEGRVERQAGPVRRPVDAGGPRPAGRAVRDRTSPPSPHRRSRRRTASPGARRRRGSSAARRSSARRPRGRRRPPRRRSSAGRGRCPSACRPSATPGGSGPCSPRPWRAGRPSAGARPGASPATGRRGAARPRRPAGGSRRSARRGSCGRPRRPDHRLAIGPRPARPRPGPAVADRRALEPGDRQDPGDARATGTPRRRRPGRSRARRPSTGRSPTRAPQPSSHDRVVPGRIAQSSDGVASSVAPSGRRAGRGRCWRSSPRTGGRRWSGTARRPRRRGAPRAGRRRSRRGTSS